MLTDVLADQLVLGHAAQGGASSATRSRKRGSRKLAWAPVRAHRASIQRGSSAKTVLSRRGSAVVFVRSKSFLRDPRRYRRRSGRSAGAQATCGPQKSTSFSTHGDLRGLRRGEQDEPVARCQRPLDRGPQRGIGRKAGLVLKDAQRSDRIRPTKGAPRSTEPQQAIAQGGASFPSAAWL